MKLRDFYNYLNKNEKYRKYPLELLIDVFTNTREDFIHKSRNSLSLYDTAIRNGNILTGTIRYSDHWDLNINGVSKLKTDRHGNKVRKMIWCKASYNKNKNEWIILKTYDYVEYTFDEFRLHIVPFMENLNSLFNNDVIYKHNISENNEINKRCRKGEIFYKGRKIKSIQPTPNYKKYIVTFLNNSRQRFNINNKSVITDYKNNIIDLSFLKPL